MTTTLSSPVLALLMLTWRNGKSWLLGLLLLGSQRHFGIAAAPGTQVPESLQDHEADHVGFPAVGEDEEGMQAIADHDLDESPLPLPAPAVDSAALLTQKDVRGQGYGYGEAGASVRAGALHAKTLTDRAIVQRTLLVGTPTISARTACERMRSSKVGRQAAKSLPEATWIAVMTAALQDSPVARYSNKKVSRLVCVVFCPFRCDT